MEVHFQDFDVNALEKFVEESIVPTVTIMDGDQINQRLVDNFMYNSNSKVRRKLGTIYWFYVDDLVQAVRDGNFV